MSIVERKKIVVTGAEGQLGSELCRQLGECAVPLGRQQLNLLDPGQAAANLKQIHPTAIINTAAFTAVDRAEEEPLLCQATNATAVGTLATVCRELDCPLVQISTDYVFGADRRRSTPYREVDEPGPLGIYGRTKLEGERQAAQWHKHFIVRTCGLYGRRNKPSQSNFVDTMLRLGRERDRLRIVDDQHCTPSSITDVAAATLFLLSTQSYGIYHIVNGGETTWHDFALEIFRLAQIQMQVDRISTVEYGALAPRPNYSVLDTTEYHALGGPKMPHWRDALAAHCLLSLRER